jgi:hypothetical protein
MANPSTYPSDGRLTSLQQFTGSLSGSELLEVVSPGNASNGINYQMTASALASYILPNGATGLPLIANGTATAPSFQQLNLGTTANVTGVLGVVNGGIGTAALALDGVVLGNATSALSVVGATTANQVLTSQGSTSPPSWQIPASLLFGRNAQTANYTLATTDFGKLIALGGNTLFQLTANTASGYESNFWCQIYNEDTGRGKTMLLNGIATSILWPQQSLLLINDNNKWIVSPGIQPWSLRVGSSITFNVDNVNGTDSSVNDGLGAQGGTGSFKTIQHAFSVIQNQTLQQGGNLIRIQLPQTTSVPVAENVSVSGALTQGGSQVTIFGNLTSATACAWQIADHQTALSLTDYNSVGFDGIGFSNSGTSACTFINAGGQFCIVDINNCDFGLNGPNGNDVAGSNQVSINVGVGNSLSGTASAFISLTDRAVCQPQIALRINGTFGMTNALLVGDSGALIDVSGPLSFTGNTTGISGQQFFMTRAAQIVGDKSVTWPPNMSAGFSQKMGLSDSATPAVGNSVFTALPSAPQAGMIACVTDSNTTAFGANIAGSGGSTVLGWYNGSHWTVVGR